MKFGVKVMPREVILYSQGRAVEQTLKSHQHNLTHCRVGKFIEIEVPASDEAQGRDMVKKMAEFVLYNPLIETYEIMRMP
ncbi:MAG TPA: phosphoribosylformylglycinamidine synthase subunit PurS [Pseudobdellovibrionaceae bacterium]|nr:phosphoribosylformylglycinamidine synthase subunit PurS [Pseudobdellovibrionaceae bacterium]